MGSQTFYIELGMNHFNRISMKSVVGVSIGVLLAGLAGFGRAAEPSVDIRFNEHIRPILSEHCFACHGPDGASRKGDLRLDLRAAAVESKTVVPGMASESELIARIMSVDEDVQMPPPEAGRRLTGDEAKLLADWIDAGAEWESHWAFIPPVREPFPGVDDSFDAEAVSDAWKANPIDRFILPRALALGLSPNKPAEIHTLARRVALDLTGLPPTSAMLDEFVNDESPDAYDRFVDKLLDSPHAGEHRARYWLDAARYGDTHGMHVDNYREMWPYRDWVIRAFNVNMPFDQFVTEQIAGDLLPTPTLQQRIASGFNRCNITTSEGGAIPEEVEVRYMIDRVETTATVFLGLTAGCAVCHDHKYDPITQKEFYQLGAFFNNTTQPPMDGNQKDSPPVVVIPADEFAAEWESTAKDRSQLTTELEKHTLALAESEILQSWWGNRQRDLDGPIADNNLLLFLPLTKSEEGATPPDGKFHWATENPVGSRGVRFVEKSEFSVDLPKLRSDQPLSISFWFRTPDRLMSTTILEQSGETKGKKKVGWRITSSTQGAVTFEMTAPSGDKIRGLLPGEEALTPRAWQHVCVRYSGGQSNTAISIVVNGRNGVLRNSTENLIEASDLSEAPLKIAGSAPTAGMSDLRIYRRWLSDKETKLLAQEFEVQKLLQSDSAWIDLKPEHQELVRQYYLPKISDAAARTSLQLAATQTRLDFVYSRSTTTLVTEERETEPVAWVLERGEYDQRREMVSPGVPQVLGLGFPKAGDDGRRNRRDLAEWLVAREHPLTARVMVNRLWQSVFGTGIVRTSEDFGVMGDAPSHPELLDWLAVEFIESGWNVRHIVRLMTTSQTYRQSARIDPAELKLDADNRYFGRGPRMRLDAEVLRDQALAVSGLLRRDLGGPSVKPYQPAGLWKVVAILGSNTKQYQKDTGDALYRRSVYTFWKRTAPPPSMATFNAPSREQCTVRREVTNTPLQALVMMNDPQFVESARHLAQRTIRAHAADNDRADFIYASVLRRPASEAERTALVQLAGKFQTLFEADEEAAKRLVRIGDSLPEESLPAAVLASWTMLANTLMNRDDFLCK
jgi:mono/diheme cytochrome c family protein